MLAQKKDVLTVKSYDQLMIYFSILCFSLLVKGFYNSVIKVISHNKLSINNFSRVVAMTLMSVNQNHYIN